MGGAAGHLISLFGQPTNTRIINLFVYLFFYSQMAVSLKEQIEAAPRMGAFFCDSL